MTDKAVAQIPTKLDRPASRQLHGALLWLVRGAYGILLLFILYSQVAGSYEFFRLTRGFTSDTSEINVIKNDNAEFEISSNYPKDYAEKYQSGIEKGDIVLSINNSVLTSGMTEDEVNTLLRGGLGEPVTLSVRRADGKIEEVTIIRLKALVDILTSLSLTPGLFFGFLDWVIVVLLFSTTVISVVIFRIQTTDWMIILVAATILLLPYTLNEFLDFELTMNVHNFWAPTLLGLKVGSALLLFTMYLFPDGRFTFSWIKWLLLATFVFTPRLAVSERLGIFGSMGKNSWWIWSFLLIGSAISQIYKYKKTANPIEKQQIKWSMIGTVGIIATLSLSEILIFSYPKLWQWGGNSTWIWGMVFLSLRNFIFVSIFLLLSSITFAFSIYRFRLWDADIYINRAVILGIVTGILAVIWAITVGVIHFLLQQFTNKQSPEIAAILSSIQVVALFAPIRSQVEKWVNKRLYKDRINFTEAIIELQVEKWQFISLKDMLELLTSKTANLIKATNSAMYLSKGEEFYLASNYGFPKNSNRKLKFHPKEIDTLRKGKTVKLSGGAPFALFVPITVSRGHINDLIGILALGKREEERDYSRDHITDLTELGKSAGVAIHFLQLNEKKNISSH